ncbi:MAG: hypothetical protein HC905_16725 [Bacteroidales bacterium]|nr:hypothetical protein [Bacteroidales bacterium]
MCGGSKKSKINTIPAFTITFGKTGGFTNINPVYTFNEKGELLKQPKENATPELLKKLPAIKVDSVYHLIKETGFLEQPLSNPGNISRYIELQKDTLKRQIIWADDHQLSPAYQKLHGYLLSLIKN